MSNDESMIKFEDLSEIFTPLQKNGKQFFTPFLYNTMYGFTLTIEIIVRHYCRLSSLLLKLDYCLFVCVCVYIYTVDSA